MQQEALAHDFTRADGAIEIDAMVGNLRLTKAKLASVLGMSRGTLSKASRRERRGTQRRLRDLVEILVRVARWAGSVPQAFAWFRCQPLPAFGDQTAADLMREGRADAVKSYISRIAVGGYT